jgi:DNA-directed RNA polymerase specialized sigma24 family protein
VPPITALTRIEPIHLERLEKQGIFTTGLLLEVSATRTRRQTLADQVDASTNDVLAWRDEALLLNLARLGPSEHDLFVQSRMSGVSYLTDLDLPTVESRIGRAAQELKVEAPDRSVVEMWWEQARTLDVG